ncbi:MAG: hypothetical protein AABZ47_14095, partial [Planctomycetota bacterium]
PAVDNAYLFWAGVPFSSVCKFKNKSNAAGPPRDCFDPNDPACTPSSDTGWQVWLPPSNSHRIANNLRIVRGGRVYLIRSTASTTWTVVGRPSGGVMSWRDGYNLVGFHVVADPVGAPTFATYLAPFIATASGVVFQYAASGTLSTLTTPATTRITPGKGYWVNSSKAGSFDGPIEIDRGSLRGVDFGQTLIEHAWSVTNPVTSARTISLRTLSSLSVPSQPVGLPTLAGGVPVSWLDYESSSATSLFFWRSLSTQSWAFSSGGQAGSRRTIRLGVNRAGLAEATLDDEGRGALYQSVLEVTDGNGFRRWLPVVAQVGAGVAGQTAGGGMTVRTGLYVGTATVNSVSWVTAGSRRWMNEDPVNPVLMNGQPGDTTVPRAAGSEFVFPVLIHVDGFGVHKMLHEVTMMWQPEMLPPGPTGRFVLVTPEVPPNVLTTLQGGSVVDGVPFARRLGTAAFHFTNAQGRDVDLVMTGSLDSTLQGTTTLAANHRLNPYRHLYHPDHDCSQEGECFDIGRMLTLTADLSAPADFRPGWGDTYFTGIYNETISGLHRNPLVVRGTFQVNRVSQIGTLNAQ